MTPCSAPWYELNISAPQDRVSACCYYSGSTDKWDDTDAPLAQYWNSPNMRQLRAIQARKTNSTKTTGCTGCKFFENAITESRANYFNFDITPTDMSAAQASNWQLAKNEFERGETELKSTPLRIYANFGFFCNLTCNFCLQVPQRKRLKNAIIKSSTLYSWKSALASALSIDIIGGEPFAQPEALKFIRRFCRDDDMQHVQLNIYTNGTLHNKHIKELEQKARLCFAISLDGIEETYERTRIGGTWKTIEDNIQLLLAIKNTSQPNWIITTNSTILKSNIMGLPAYAQWHVENGIQTWFYDFINTAGNQDTFFTENVIANPSLLTGIENWESYFIEAIEVFERGGQVYSAETLQLCLNKIHQAFEKQKQERQWIEEIRQRPRYPVICANTPGEVKQLLASASNGLISKFTFDADTGLFTEAHEADQAISQWFDVSMQTNGKKAILLSAFWLHSKAPLDRHAHISIQDQNQNVIRGRRDYTKTEKGIYLTMTVPLTNSLKSVRLSITPTGETKSFIPVSFSIDLA